MLERVRRQVALGPRVPGSRAHGQLCAQLGEQLERYAARVVRQRFPVALPGGTVECTNLAGVFPASGERRGGAAGLLIGTHYDTRLRADRESDPDRRDRPIPGANDGGSGTAVLLQLLPFLAQTPHEREVTVVFFDAEDVGDISGNPFSLGAQRFVEGAPVELPVEAVILDMVGGRALSLDVDAHILHHPPSLGLTYRLFSLGQALELPAFGPGAPWGRALPRDKLRYIISDQYPFMVAGIAACLLIDLDYPQWHTQEDLPAAMAPESLATIAAVLRRFLLQPAP